MKDFLERFEELATQYPDVAITIAIVMALGFALVLNLYGKTIKEQIKYLEKQNTDLKTDNARLKQDLLEASESSSTYRNKLRRLESELNTYAELESELMRMQREIDNTIQRATIEEQDAELLRKLRQGRARFQEFYCKFTKFETELRETVKAAQDLEENQARLVDQGVNKFFEKRRKGKKRTWFSTVKSYLNQKDSR